MRSVEKFLMNQIAVRNPRRFKFIPDKQFLKIKFYNKFQREINFDNPKTFNEKIQWLKINDRNPVYKQLVDKLSVRTVVSKTIGEEYLVGFLGVWEKFEEIDFEKLPNNFVIKTTHDSGGVIICTNKHTLNFEVVENKISKSLRRNYYYSGREWPYKDIKPRIIVEEFIDNDGFLPDDYKIMCFNGKPDNIMVCTDRNTSATKYFFFDTNWELMRCNGWGKEAPKNFTLPKPPNLDKMLEIATILSNEIPLARIDLYNVKGKIYFGEITLYPDSGFDNNLLSEADELFGNKLLLK